MRNLIVIFILVLFATAITSCIHPDGQEITSDAINNSNSASGKGDTTSFPKFSFVSTEHDFGKIVDGVKVSFKYKFTNVGGSPIIISSVKTSCGCTASNWTKEPVSPGESGVVELTFDSSNRLGPNQKTATVIANTQPNTLSLSFTAEVVNIDDF